MKKTSTSSPHLENLTWLRALAAFFVVISHSIRTAEVQYSSNDEKSYFLPLSLMDQGSFGVCLFFALSGCTLYLSNSKSLSSPKEIIIFYINRALRIWPNYAFSLALYLIFSKFFALAYTGDKTLWAAQFLKDYTTINVIQYLSLTFNITGPRDLFIGPYWSLPIEFQYYLILPLSVVFMTSRIKSILTPIIFGIILHLFYTHPFVGIDRTEFFQLGFTFFGGVFLAYLSNWIKPRIPASIGIALIGAFITSVGLVVTNIMVIQTTLPFISNKWNYYGVSGLICVAIALFSTPPKVPHQLHFLLSKYGEVSYSIYLYHMLFIGISAIAITRFEIYGNFPKLLFTLGTTVVFSFLFSTITYKFIEKPCIDFGKNIKTNQVAVKTPSQ